ncbi:hypothetical protein QR680_002845 [Steinernema hermaphroditum]|uniref:ShKT domain-containing protein n=1 Tax=Steinernema hermaphroditum TaxID=289476 RepID=A0AA39H648_9BILA|nr:hypothetical protein QR680_002845 [Steinernema hermaphroditum]
MITIGYLVFVLLSISAFTEAEDERSKRFVATYHHVGKECPKVCYNHLVHTVAPVDITGLIEIRIARKRRGRYRRHYSSDLEAFQHTCWTYRHYTSKCLTACHLSPGKAWFQDVFFNILDNYCITYYDHVLANWNCFQKIKKFYSICEKQCDDSCDPTCVLECHRPLINRHCRHDDPIAILRKIIHNVHDKVAHQVKNNRIKVKCPYEVIEYGRRV